MQFPSNRTLGKIVVYGAIASISAVMYMRHKIEQNIRGSEYFKIALSTLRQSTGAVSLLGEPIKEVGFDLSDSENFCDGDLAKFEVKVKGSKERGIISFTAKHMDNGWCLEKMDLQVKSHPDKIFRIKTSGTNI